MLRFSIAFLGCVLALGCGSDDGDGDDDAGSYDCESFCTDSAACPDSDDDPAMCDAECRALGDANRDSGCASAFDRFLSCAGDLGNLCDEAEGAECDAEAMAYVDCLATWCAQNPDRIECGAAGG